MESRNQKQNCLENDSKPTLILYSMNVPAVLKGPKVEYKLHIIDSVQGNFKTAINLSNKLGFP